MTEENKSFLMEYKGHKCVGYNIGAHFYGNEEYIISGSEDSNIYVYNKLKGGAPEKTFQTKSTVIHFVKPIPSQSGP